MFIMQIFKIIKKINARADPLLTSLKINQTKKRDDESNKKKTKGVNMMYWLTLITNL